MRHVPGDGHRPASRCGSSSLLGLFNLFDTITRPAITAIIRSNYPVESRGLVTGRLRQWNAGIFLVAAFATARCWIAPAPGP